MEKEQWRLVLVIGAILAPCLLELLAASHIAPLRIQCRCAGTWVVEFERPTKMILSGLHKLPGGNPIFAAADTPYSLCIASLATYHLIASSPSSIIIINIQSSQSSANSMIFQSFAALEQVFGSHLTGSSETQPYHQQATIGTGHVPPPSVFKQPPQLGSALKFSLAHGDPDTGDRAPRPASEVSLAPSESLSHTVSHRARARARKTVKLPQATSHKPSSHRSSKLHRHRPASMNIMDPRVHPSQPSRGLPISSEATTGYQPTLPSKSAMSLLDLTGAGVAGGNAPQSAASGAGRSIASLRGGEIDREPSLRPPTTSTRYIRDQHVFDGGEGYDVDHPGYVSHHQGSIRSFAEPRPQEDFDHDNQENLPLRHGHGRDPSMRSQRSGHRPPTGYHPATSLAQDRHSQWPTGEPYEEDPQQDVDAYADWQTPEITAYSPVTEEASVVDRMTLGQRSRAGTMGAGQQGGGAAL